MSTFQPANSDVRAIVNDIIKSTECHKWISELPLKIDLVMAYGTRNDEGELIGNAIMHHGVPALGLCRIIPLKDQAGQFYWPELVKVADVASGSVTIKAGDHEPVTMSNRRFSQIAKELGTK